MQKKKYTIQNTSTSFIRWKCHDFIILIINCMIIIYFINNITNNRNEKSHGIAKDHMIITNLYSHTQHNNHLSNHNYTYNPLYSYPITLDGTLCFPKDLQKCITKGKDNIDSNDGICCKKLWNNSIVPYQQVPNALLLWIGIIWPIIFIILRTLIWRIAAINRSKSNNNDIYPPRIWVLRTWEAILGLLSASMYQMFTINMFKEFVRGPRPIYYALRLWSSVNSIERSEFFGTSTRSFPSGHSGTSASGLGYLICLVLRDAYNIRDSNPIMSSILGQSCTVLLFCTIIWVGSTRITDYWHFQHDVITGWTIGFLSAIFGFLLNTGENTKIISSIGTGYSQKDLHAETFDDDDGIETGN